MAAVDSEPACSGSGGGSEHAGGGSEPAGGGSGGAESDPNPDHGHSEQPMPPVVLVFSFGENAASSVGADDTSSILTAPTATPAAAPTATPAAHASMQDQEPASGGAESPAPSSPTEVGLGPEKHSPTVFLEDELMEDAPEPEEVAPSTPAGGEEGAAQKATLAADASIEGVPEPAGVSQVCISPSPGTPSPGGQYQDILPSISEEEHVGEPGQGCS